MAAKANLTSRQKAAVIVRLLLEENAELPLSGLNERAQSLLAQEMAGLELIDRVTLDGVVNEFCDLLDAVGMTFPGNLDGTLDILGAYLSDDTTDNLRRMAALNGRGDPWVRLSALSLDKIHALAKQESVDLIALLLAKLPVGKASEVFSGLGPDRAYAVAQAMSLAGNVTPQTLLRVGTVLLQAADALPRPGLESPVVDRVGAILNFASAEIRDSVLEGLETENAEFAGGVRKAIFTYAHIVDRIERRDVPKIVRDVDPKLMLNALAGATGKDAATSEFILANLSQRMAEGLRDDIAALGKVRKNDAEEAMAAVIATIRSLQGAGELHFRLPEDEEAAA